MESGRSCLATRVYLLPLRHVCIMWVKQCLQPASCCETFTLGPSCRSIVRLASIYNFMRRKNPILLVGLGLRGTMDEALGGEYRLIRGLCHLDFLEHKIFAPYTSKLHISNTFPRCFKDALVINKRECI